MNSIFELTLLDLFQKLFPHLGVNQNQLDNPTPEFVSLFYQEYKNKLSAILSNTVKDVEPDEARRTEGDSIYSLVRFINFTAQSVDPNIEPMMTFKLVNNPNRALFKTHVRPLLKLLWNVEEEFINIKDVLVKRSLDFKQLQSKRAELDDLKKKLASNISEITTNEKHYAKLQRNHENVQLRYKKLSQHQDAEKIASDKLKEEVKCIVDEHDNLKVLMTNINGNIEHLNKQIVTEDSYERLLHLKENINVICNELASEEGSIQENLRGKKLDIERFNIIDTQVDRLNNFANKLLNVHEKYIGLLVKHKNINKGVQELSDKMQKVNSTIIQLNEIIRGRKKAIQNTNIRNVEDTKRFGQEVFEIKELLIQEQEKQEQQQSRKKNIEETLLHLNKSCLEVRSEIADVNASHQHLYQKFIKLENNNTERLSNAFLNITNILKNFK